MQELSNTLILIYQDLKEPVNTPQVQELSYKFESSFTNAVKQPCSTPKQVQELSYNVESHLPTVETAWQHTKTSAGVELLVDFHLTTLVNSLQHTKTSTGVELHVNSHLTTLETAWQHPKASAEVELHFDSHLQKIQNSLAAHQNQCRS